MDGPTDLSPRRPDIVAAGIDNGTSESDRSEASCGGRLTIGPGAIVRDYRALAASASGFRVAAVVKADVYGLGVGRVQSQIVTAVLDATPLLRKTSAGG
ncbi:hypothetical protein [Methylobacterium mesophilicum]